MISILVVELARAIERAGAVVVSAEVEVVIVVSTIVIAVVLSAIKGSICVIVVKKGWGRRFF